MAIDESQEKLYYLRDIPQHLPMRGDGRPLLVATIRNWIRAGVAGIKLEYTQVGGSMCTSLEAVQRMTAAVTAAKSRRKQRATAAPANNSPPAGSGGAAVAADAAAPSDQPAKRPRGRPRKNAA
jgi:hypothetical protein